MATKKNTNSKTVLSPVSSRGGRTTRREPAATSPEPPNPESALQTRRQPSSEKVDEELTLTFLTFFHTLEQALVRAGYTRAGRTPGSTQADWARFARHIETQFNPDSSLVLQGAVAYLLWDETNLARRNALLEEAYPWESASPYSDIVWLSELVRQTHTQLTYDLNFPGPQRCDIAQVTAALFVVEEWASLDPEVKSLIMSGL